jgi:hypothetical protein
MGATIHHHAEEHLLDGIPTDSGCKYDPIAVKKHSKYSFRQVDINEQIGHKVSD